MKSTPRNQRVAAMMRILSDAPNRIFTYAYFCEIFQCAKASISEDVAILKETCERFDYGRIETIAGANGGVRYLPGIPQKRAYKLIREMCYILEDPSRVLPGGWLYLMDMLNNPNYAAPMGEMLAGRFTEEKPDFVLTVETGGIPLALMTARALNVPMAVARRELKTTEGNAITVSFMAGSSDTVRTMSLSVRAAKAGQKALLIDDFMKGGGSIRGMMTLMQEMHIDVVGVGVMLAAKGMPVLEGLTPVSLMVFEGYDASGKKTRIRPAAWLKPGQ